MKKTILIFLLILMIAALLRFYKLNLIPPSLNWDEISIGYNAYSILKTGRDEWGSFLPISFRAYGDYKLPGYVYLDVPFIAIFGLNEIGVRLPSALLGLGTVIFIYFLVRKLTKNKFVALIGMFIAAITPWLLIFSRIALEANLALFLVTGSVFFLFKGIEKGAYLILSATFMSLAFFSYNSSRVVIPPFVLIVIFLLFKKLKEKGRYAITGLTILSLTFFLVIPQALLSDSSARYRWIKIVDEGAINRINELRGSSALPPMLDRLTYNKVTYFVPQAASNYFSHFTPNFLFINGGSNYQYSVPGSGLLLWVCLPLFLLGLYQSIKERKVAHLVCLGWLLIAPLPGAITRDAPHALRALFMIPPLLIISSFGLDFLSKFKKPFLQITIWGILLAIILPNFYLFWLNYTIDYPKNYSWSWQYGYKQVVDFVNMQASNYDNIYITKKYGEPHEFFLFHSKFDPQKYQTDSNLVRYFRSDWYWVDRFDKYQFVNDWEIVEKLKDKNNLLLVTSPGNYPKKAYAIKTINFLDGKPAFDIVRLQ